MSDSSWSGSESALPTGEDAACDDGQRPGSSLDGASSSSGTRKRPAPLLAEGQGSCSRPRGECSGGFEPTSGDYEQFDAYRDLNATQKTIINRLVGRLDSQSDSVVITNPLAPSGPIVYVTNAWQQMCGYTMSQAVGQNPRLTQGEGTDPDTVRTMRLALNNQQPCRVRIVNYRGYNREPFWNCLSVHPIFFNKQLVLFAARLKDYSHMLSPLVSLTPQQFCKAGDLFQVRVRLPDVSPTTLSQPRCVDVTDADLAEGGADAGAGDSSSSSAAAAAAAPPVPARHVKRLGFGGLCLEPEYLVDRLRHECAELSLPCKAQEVRVQGAEVLRMEIAAMGGAASGAQQQQSGGGGGSGESLRALVHVMPEDTDGSYSISLMRLVGDTFEFHALYRSLRERLNDITVPTDRGGGGGSSRRPLALAALGVGSANANASL